MPLNRNIVTIIPKQHDLLSSYPAGAADPASAADPVIKKSINRIRAIALQDTLR